MENTIEIQKYLPHRVPMLMVDLIVSMDHEKVKTIFTVTGDNVFVENGQFSEAGLIENAAQTCSAIVGSSYFVDNTGEDIPGAQVIGFISSIKTVKVHALPQVGSEITTAAVLKSSFDMGSYTTCTMECSIYNDTALLLEGEINLFIQGR